MTEPSEARDPKTYAVIGAAMEVHNVRGPGFLEIVYRDCCGIEFNERNIPFVMEVPFPLTYKGHRVGGYFGGPKLTFQRFVMSSNGQGKAVE